MTIDRYLDRGDMYVLFQNENALCECVVTDEGEGVLELKNIATAPGYQGQGYGRRLIDYIIERYSEFTTLIVGTADSPTTLPFYERYGFVQYKRVENFFVDNYDHPIYEGGKQLIDMVYLRLEIQH